MTSKVIEIISNNGLMGHISEKNDGWFIYELKTPLM